MRTIQAGEAELRVVRIILDAAEHNLPTPRLNAKQRQALRTFMRRVSLGDKQEVTHG